MASLDSTTDRSDGDSGDSGWTIVASLIELGLSKATPQPLSAIAGKGSNREFFGQM